jgi:hypothetical protein
MKSSNEPYHPADPPMTLGNMRSLGVQSLIASCLNDACRHTALLDVSSYPAETEVPSFGRRAMWQMREQTRRCAPEREAAAVEREPDRQAVAVNEQTTAKNAAGDVCYGEECVAKPFANHRTSNHRIRLNGVLNRCCAFGLVLESILLFGGENSFATHSGVERKIFARRKVFSV